ncbi:hypothetical protein BVRB_032470, partial [Beta vulgaris subsp. vulgaris]
SSLASIVDECNYHVPASRISSTQLQYRVHCGAATIDLKYAGHVPFFHINRDFESLLKRYEWIRAWRYFVSVVLGLLKQGVLLLLLPVIVLYCGICLILCLYTGGLVALVPGRTIWERFDQHWLDILLCSIPGLCYRGEVHSLPENELPNVGVIDNLRMFLFGVEKSRTQRRICALIRTQGGQVTSSMLAPILNGYSELDAMIDAVVEFEGDISVVRSEMRYQFARLPDPDSCRWVHDSVRVAP